MVRYNESIKPSSFFKTKRASGASNKVNFTSCFSLEESSKNTDKKVIESCIKKIALIDSSIKGQSKNNPWIEIKDLTLEFIG